MRAPTAPATPATHPRSRRRSLTFVCVTVHRAVGTVSADCTSDCAQAETSAWTTCGITGVTTGQSTTCQSGCQDAIDILYSTCDCTDNWDITKPTVKATVEAYGCAGAAHAAPALFVGVAALVNHFLN
jgi:hypothetical protein